MVSKGDGDNPVKAKNLTTGLFSKDANNKNNNKAKTLRRMLLKLLILKIDETILL